MVVNAAQRAFREHDAVAAGRASLVFDSTRDDIARGETSRVLMLTAESFDLVLTIASTSRGKAVGGALMTAGSLSVAIRRPLRATIALPVNEEGGLGETIVPAGAACVIVRDESGEAWVSDWLTL